MSTQCTATTKTKRRCKKTQFCSLYSTLCKQHWLQARGTHEPPWLELGLTVEPHAELSAKTLAKLEALLYRGPNLAAVGVTRSNVLMRVLQVSVCTCGRSSVAVSYFC
jgi:hypothetical protein